MDEVYRSGSDPLGLGLTAEEMAALDAQGQGVQKSATGN
jgi:hypothetical protein